MEILNIDFDLDSRYVHESEDERIRVQERVRVGFVVDVDGHFELVGIAATGTNFDSAWADVYDSTGSHDGRTIVFRNLYLKKKLGDVTVEAGALRPGTNSTVGSGGLAPGGWMDGLRVEADTKIGRIKVVAGSLGDFDQPDMFRRKFKGNFIELELEQKVFENLLSETGIQTYNGDLYFRQNLSSKIEVLGDKVLRLLAGALYDVERGKINYDIGVEFDVLKTILDKYDGRLNLRLYYSYVDENIPDREQMFSSFHTTGHRGSVHMSGRIDKQGRLNWYYRSSFGENKRQDIGVTLRIPLGKKELKK